MILDKIDVNEIEVEIEKGLTKARYNLMNTDETGNENAAEENNDDVNIGHNNRNEGNEKTLNYANLRATDIPTVQRLYPPKLHGEPVF